MPPLIQPQNTFKVAAVAIEEQCRGDDRSRVIFSGQIAFSEKRLFIVPLYRHHHGIMDRARYFPGAPLHAPNHLVKYPLDTAAKYVFAIYVYIRIHDA